MCVMSFWRGGPMIHYPGCVENEELPVTRVPDGSVGEKLELPGTRGRPECQMDARRERGWRGTQWGGSREGDRGENMKDRIEACLV